jgi:Icc-related predicted phosphoesterase
MKRNILSKNKNYILFLFLISINLYSTSIESLRNKIKLDSSDKLVLAFLSDIEADDFNLRKAINKIKAVKKIDAIIVAGDLYENESLRKNPLFPNSKDNVSEMVNSLLLLLELNVPLFVIPGNHERQIIYNRAISFLQDSGYENIFDINKQVLDLEGVNIVGLGGYHLPGRTPEDGFLLTSSDYDWLNTSLENLSSQNEPIIMVTHGPPKDENSNIDYLENVGHVGDIKFTKILENPLNRKLINVHGHLHEKSKTKAVFKSGVSYNISSITSYHSLNGGGEVSLLILNKLRMIEFKTL